MQEFEKILEEIDKDKEELKKYQKIGKPEDLIREEDVVKFYYCESEDDYYIGKRIQNMYYAKYSSGSFTWFMSRFLPWGEHVIAPEAAWKEYTYPTEPKEIPFTEWLDGFIRKYMYDGWIPVAERLPTKEEYLKDDGRFILDDGNRRYQGLFDIYDSKFKFSKHISGIKYELFEDKSVIAWRPLPEPYQPYEKQN